MGWNHNYYVELYTQDKGNGLYAVTHHFFAYKSMEPQLLYCYSPTNSNRIFCHSSTNPNLIFFHSPKWKTTKMEDDQNGRRPKWKTTKMEDDLNGRRPKWKTTKMEDNITKMKMTKNK